MDGPERPKVSGNLKLNKAPFDHDQVAAHFQELRNGPPPKHHLDEYLQKIPELDVSSALDRLTIADTLTSYITSQPVDKDKLGLPPAQHKYLIGLLLTHCTKEGKNEWGFKQLAGPITDLSIKSIFAPEVPPDASKDDILKERVKFALRQQMFTAGEFVFSGQSIEAASRAYSPHDDYLIDEVGFTIQDAIDCVEYLAEKFAETREHLYRLDAFRLAIAHIQAGDYTDHMTVQIQETGSLEMGSKSQDFTRDSLVIEKLYEEANEESNSFAKSRSALVQDLPNDIDSNRFNHVLDRLSSTIGESTDNPEFRWPYQFNPFEKTPLIQYEGEYYSPDGNALLRALRKSFYYDLITMEEYGDPSGHTGGKFGQLYGDYLEDWSEDCFEKIAPTNRIKKNPLYNLPGFPEACDVLIEGDDTLFVVECKVGKIPLSLRNSDFETIQHTIQSRIGEGYANQALPLIEKMRDGELSVLIHNGKKFEIPDYERYQPIIVIEEPYDSIATYLIDVVIEMEDVTPFVLDIFDLQILTEYFDSISKFELYVKERTEIFDKRAIISPDEIDYLGLFIENNESFPEIPEKQSLQIEDMSHVVGSEIDYKFGY